MEADTLPAMTNNRTDRIQWCVAGLLLVTLLYLAFATGFAIWHGLGPNGSTDGRAHTCGYVTEDGVTDHLANYHQRCGK